MVGVNLQDAAPFVNPKNVVGANSAGPLQTATFPNFAEPPEIFGNNKVFLTNNMYPGTSNKVGGKRRSKPRRSKKRRGSKRSNAGMHKKRSSSSHSRKRSSSRKKSSSPHTAPANVDTVIMVMKVSINNHLQTYAKNANIMHVKEVFFAADVLTKTQVT